MRIGPMFVKLAFSLLAAPIPGAAEDPPTCPGGEVPRPDLGIRSLACHCSFEIDDEGLKSHWRFEAEPEVLAVGQGSQLLPGDQIVGIDGRPITTAAGGDRWSSLRPGDQARVKVRRGGAVIIVDLAVGHRCPSDSELTPPVASRPPEPLPRLLPRGWLGLGLSCDCSVDTQRGSPRWTFRDAPGISQVAPGGPAARAGLRPGDTLLEIDGQTLTGSAGGAAFSALEPGQRVRLLFLRGGEEHTVEVVTEKRPDGEEPRP